jgi:zinc/manganese transport system substrate-binding protein
MHTCVRHSKPHYTIRLWRMALVMGLILTMLAACGNQPATGTTTSEGATPATPATTATAETSTGKLKVVATYSILGDLVANVGGEQIELRTLVPAGGDAHTFEPSPTDSAALVDAALIFENGLEFEGWLPELYDAAQTEARRVVVTEGIEPLPVAEGHVEEDADHAEEDADHGDEGATAEGAEHAEEGDHSDETATSEEAEHEEHGEYDPHMWHDVNNAIMMVERIRDSLAEADAANAATYQRNAEAYIGELKALDAYVVEQTAKVPADQRKLVTTHDTFQYFAHRYDFEIVGTALGSVSTEVADPSARNIADLVDEIKATGTRAIFAENIEGGGIMERIANEAGVELGASLYTDALGEPGSDGDTYVKMIRYNIDAIVAALSA